MKPKLPNPSKSSALGSGTNTVPGSWIISTFNEKLQDPPEQDPPFARGVYIVVSPGEWIATGPFQTMLTVPFVTLKVPDRVAVTVLCPTPGRLCEIVTAKEAALVPEQEPLHLTCKVPKF